MKYEEPVIVHTFVPHPRHSRCAVCNRNRDKHPDVTPTIERRPQGAQ